MDRLYGTPFTEGQSLETKVDLETTAGNGQAGTNEEPLAKMSPEWKAVASTLRGMLREVVDESFGKLAS